MMNKSSRRTKKEGRNERLTRAGREIMIMMSAKSTYYVLPLHQALVFMLQRSTYLTFVAIPFGQH